MGKDRRGVNGRPLKDSAPFTFGLIIILGFFGIMVGLLVSKFPLENKDLITSLAKTLETAFIMAISYWMGASASGKAKDETISDIAKMPVTGLGASDIPAKDVKVQAEGDVTVTKE